MLPTEKQKYWIKNCVYIPCSHFLSLCKYCLPNEIDRLVLCNNVERANEKSYTFCIYVRNLAPRLNAGSGIFFELINSKLPSVVRPHTAPENKHLRCSQIVRVAGNKFRQAAGEQCSKDTLWIWALKDDTGKVKVHNLNINCF